MGYAENHLDQTQKILVEQRLEELKQKYPELQD
jgi:hypothetical protein